MNTDICNVLSDSLHMVKVLLDLLEVDEADMPSCVKGEILDEYRKATAMARDKTLKVEKRLMQLQKAELQRSGM